MDSQVFFPTNEKILTQRNLNLPQRDSQIPKSTGLPSFRHLELNSSLGSRMSRFKENSIQRRSNATYSSRKLLFFINSLFAVICQIFLKKYLILAGLILLLEDGSIVKFFFPYFLNVTKKLRLC